MSDIIFTPPSPAPQTAAQNFGTALPGESTYGSSPSANSAGSVVGRSVLTAASANFKTGPQTNTIKVKGLGGGGGGGGAPAAGAGLASVGSGGGQAGYVEKTFAVTPNTNYAYTCGNGGTGVLGAGGTAGGDSTFTVGATTVTAHGGTGGNTSIVTAQPVSSGIQGGTSAGGDLNISGAPGSPGFVLNATGPLGSGGNGGGGTFGNGGVGTANTSAAGGAAPGFGQGFGAGGGGAIAGASTGPFAGGAGTQGAWFVEEFL